MDDLGDSLLEEYIKWCRLPWWRRALRRIFNTGIVFAGHELPAGYSATPSGDQK